MSVVCLSSTSVGEDEGEHALVVFDETTRLVVPLQHPHRPPVAPADGQGMLPATAATGDHST